MKIRPIVFMWILGLFLGACTQGGDTPNPAANPAAALSKLTQPVTFQASDGVQLYATVRGASPLAPRPTIIEFSPYGNASDVPDFGPAYNHVFVHARGTGNSTGVWSAVGPNDQKDVSEFVAWACHQPWSNGHIGLYGFSASAIAVYNSMHLPLACVDAAALMAGSEDLYRDLLYPGGIFNFAPAVSVGFGVGAPFLQSAAGRPQDAASSAQSGLGQLGLYADILSHQTEDDYWLARTQRAGPNTFPILADTSFYDPEPRGPFESFKRLRAKGTQIHFITFGAHDGFPTGTAGPFPEYQRWFDHYLLGVDNGIERDPAVQLLLGNGSFAALKSGSFTRVNANDWPVPGTRWQKFFLDPTRGGGATSSNDGTLRATAPSAQSSQPYLALASLPTATDPHTTGTVAAAGASTLFDALPFLTQLKLMEPTALTYTTPAFTQAVDVAGSASLDVFVTTATPETDLYAVVADVWPDGNAYAVGVGRLRTSFPNIDRTRSVMDGNGEVVQPYSDFSVKTYATPGQAREYHVEFWPIGNHFAVGHRLRLYLLGTSGYMLPTPGVNLVSVGGATPSRLLLPVLPGSDALTSIGGSP
jgi:putative CocE/NonD family hydrolase